MFVLITKPVLLVAYTHEPATGQDIASLESFLPGEIVRVGEVHGCRDDCCSTVELIGKGFANIANDSWEPYEGIVLPYIYDGRINPN